MKRAVFPYLFTFIYLVANCIAFVQSDTQSDDRKPCPFSIIGLWRSAMTTQSNPIFFNFSSNGWVTLLSYAADTRPQDFEMLTEVSYKLDKPAAPKHIEFRTNRGNDAFVPGITLLEVIDYSDESFTTLDQVSEQKIRWVREQTHRYFLTFAARSAQLSPDQFAFTMWTVLDGRKAKIEALGVHSSKDETGTTIPIFGQIPAELCEHITEDSERDRQSKKAETVIIRFELTQAEFEKNHQLYEMWEQYVKTQTLPYNNPYVNEMEFLSRALDGLNPCGAKAKLYKVAARQRDEIVSQYRPSQQPFEYIRVMRRKNDELHIDDSMFPWNWRPTLQIPAQ
jgi:hypothetical protein